MGKHQIGVKVNGVKYESEVESRLLLVQYLREHLGLTGTHVGCDTSNCGACTVLMNGVSVKSCTVFAVQSNGSEVTTVEGIATGGRLHPVQEALWDNHAVQCGYCSAGLVMQLHWFLREERKPTEAEIRKGIAGNLCMCTGYESVVRAAIQAAKAMGKNA